MNPEELFRRFTMKSLNQNNRYFHPLLNTAENGVIFIEFAMAFSLLLIIVLGMAQQYVHSLKKLNHYSIATQVLMGPQEPSLIYDSATGTFEKLGNATVPSHDDFLSTIGNFILSLTPDDDYAAYIKLAYITVDPTTGEPTGYDVSVDPFGYPEANATDCLDKEYAFAVVNDFAESRLSLMVNSAQAKAPADVNDDNGRIGIKIYDFKLGATRYRQYSELMPFAFLYLCSPPINISFAQKVETFHMIAPRRLAN